MEYVTVGDVEIPALGLGTYQLRGTQCVESVSTALEIGYRHIDTAEFYENERQVGRALAESPIDEDELFVTTKVWRSNLAGEDVHRSARASREKLGLETIDLLLIHWPSRSVAIRETIGAMNELQDAGLVDHIGVSNFSVGQLEEAIDASRTPIITNQVKYHPFHGQDELLSACIERDVMLTAYSPLAKGSVVDDDTLERIADRYGKTPAQVALRWLVQQENVAAIPKATSRAHLESNCDIFDFSLSDAEMEAIFELQGGLLAGLRSRLGL